jgi:V8-like Glu-specific endopeptidase
MFRRTSLLGLASVTAATALVMAPTSGAVTTSARTTSASHGSVVVHEAATTLAEHKRIVSYWTPARMATAVPGERLAPRGTGPTVQVAVGKPARVGPQQPATFGVSYLGGPWTGGGQVVKSTGKVFFTLGGTNYVCSGNVVTATNRDTVSTAGHCLNEGPGAFATNFAFVPAYNNNNRPYGTFTARSLTTTVQWRDSGDFNYDVGFAVMNTLGGQHLADVVGTQGIAFNQPRGQFLYAFGYPAAKPYNGQVLDYCSDTATNDTRGNTNDERLDCNMTGGSSGGPWFAGFNESTGIGTQLSVNSFGYRGERNAMYGPYFGSVVQSVYSSASTL